MAGYFERVASGTFFAAFPTTLGERIKRARQDIVRFRNEFVAALADQVFVVYATPGGKTENFCKKVLGWGKPFLTFNSPGNAALLASGAQPSTNLDVFTRQGG
jgi:hypothetical protein